MRTLIWINVALRGMMEAGIVAALAYWGTTLGGSLWASVAFGIIVPTIGFGFWGLVDFRNMGLASEALRLIQELLVSGLAAFALYSAGEPDLAFGLAGLSLLHHALVYLLGTRLLKDQAT